MKKIFLSKAKDQIARHNTIRDINRRIVLNYVRVRSPISRAEIARETSLQRSTVSAIVDDLLQEGMIEEIGAGDSTGGRKPTLLQLKVGIPTAIGVDVTPRVTTVVVADLAGTILSSESFPTSADIEYMNRQIVSKVAVIASEHSDLAMEVGISIPGVADPSHGNINYVPYFQWSNWNIGEQITNETGLSVVIDNDANAVALAELWFSSVENRKSQNFIVVMIAEGIGTGIIIDGQVYRGSGGAAGEFGHMFLGPNAPVDCSCGRRDCWEAHASEKAILKRYSNGNGVVDGLHIEQILELAANGEKRALEIVNDSARSIGIGISNLIVGFSPDTVIVCGSLVKAWELVGETIKSVAQRTMRVELEEIAIVPSQLGETPTIMGSVSLVLSRKFSANALIE